MLDSREVLGFQRRIAGGDRTELFVDSDFASKATDRRSVSGSVVMFAGACVMYLCRTQKSVTLSSMEAEYIAMVDGMKEDIFLQYLWSFIFPDRDVGCTLIHEGIVSAIRLACNPATTPNSKHIDIRHHFVRERVEREEFKVVHVRSDLQRADFLTKPLPQQTFCAHRDFVMNIRWFLFLCRNSCLGFYCSCFSALRDTCWFSGKAAFSLS